MLQGLKRADILRPVERSHRSIEMADHLGHAIGHRRIDGAGLVEPGSGEIGLLGGQDRVAEDLGLLGLVIRAEHDFDDFLEVEQPIRQVQSFAGAEDHSLVAERGGIFAMRIDQHDMGMRVPLDDRAEDRGNDTGLARAGGADDAEMLAEQLVGQDIGRHGAILVQRADPRRRDAGARIDER